MPNRRCERGDTPGRPALRCGEDALYIVRMNGKNPKEFCLCHAAPYGNYDGYTVERIDSPSEVEKARVLAAKRVREHASEAKLSQFESIVVIAREFPILTPGDVAEVFRTHG